MITERAGRHEEFLRLKKELERPENSRLQAIHKGYALCLTEFLSKRHRIIAPLLKRVGLFATTSARTEPDREGHAASAEEVFASDPEISTLHEYCS